MSSMVACKTDKRHVQLLALLYLFFVSSGSFFSVFKSQSQVFLFQFLPVPRCSCNREFYSRQKM